MRDPAPLLFRGKTARRLARVGAALLLGALAAAPGCNYAAAAAYVIAGPPKVDARYKLDKTKKTVVFIDDRTNVVPRRSLRLVMGETVESELILNAGMDPALLIPAQSTLRATSAERLGTPMTVVDIGRVVGAEIIIYAVVKKFALTPDGVVYSPSGEAEVKIFDATNNRRLFPPSGDGLAVNMLLPMTDNMPTGIAEKNAAEEAAARALGVQIARTFYSYERDALSGNLDD